MINFEDINWDDINSNITDNFTVHELTYLPSWQIHHTPSQDEKQNLYNLALKMEEIREFLGKAINVHVAIRPTVVNCPNSPYNGRNYNAIVGGAPKSAHIYGLAMDFNPYEMICDEARLLLEPQLATMNIRMEKRPGSSWVHCDLFLPSPNRYFIP